MIPMITILLECVQLVKVAFSGAKSHASSSLVASLHIAPKFTVGWRSIRASATRRIKREDIRHTNFDYAFSSWLMSRRGTDDRADTPSFGRLPRRMSTSSRSTPDSVSGSHMSGPSRRPVLEDLIDQTSSDSEPQQTHATTGHRFGMPHMQHMAMQESMYFPGYQQMPDDMAQYMQTYSSLLGQGGQQMPPFGGAGPFFQPPPYRAPFGDAGRSHGHSIPPFQMPTSGRIPIMERETSSHGASGHGASGTGGSGHGASGDGAYTGRSSSQMILHKSSQPPTCDPASREEPLSFEYDEDREVMPIPPGRGPTEISKAKEKYDERLFIRPLPKCLGFSSKKAETDIVGLLKRFYSGEEFWCQVSKRTRNDLWREFGMRYRWEDTDEEKIATIWEKVNHNRFIDMLTHAKNKAYKKPVGQREKWLKEREFRILMKRWENEDKKNDALQKSKNRGVVYDESTGVVMQKAPGTYTGGNMSMFDHAHSMSSDATSELYKKPACERERPVEDPKFNPLTFVKTHIKNTKEMEKFEKRKKKKNCGDTPLSHAEEGEDDSGAFVPDWIAVKSNM